MLSTSLNGPLSTLIEPLILSVLVFSEVCAVAVLRFLCTVMVYGKNTTLSRLQPSRM